MKKLFRMAAFWMLTQAVMLVSLFAQTTAEIRRVRLPSVSSTELNTELVASLPIGTIFFVEDSPGTIYISTGTQPLKLLPEPDWNHIATRTIEMRQNALNFDGRYNLRGNGVTSQWDANNTAVIVVSGNSVLVRITAFSYDAEEDEVTLTVDAGAVGVTPSVEWTASLTSPSWAAVPGAVVSESDSSGISIASFEPPAAVSFYRVTAPYLDPPTVDVKAVTTIHTTQKNRDGFFDEDGDAQVVKQVLRASTPGATPTDLLRNGQTLSIDAGRMWAGTVQVAGIRSTGATAAHYIRKFAIKRVGSTTSLVGSVSSVGTDVEDVGGYDVSITADDTGDALKVTVTGAASETIRWVAHLEYIDVEIGD